jgi:small-conductance mechanosensitive channel
MAQRLGAKLAAPVALATCFGLVYLLAKGLLSLPQLVTVLLLIAFIFSVAWLATRAIGYLIDRLTQTEVDDISDLSGNDYSGQQRRLTMLSVGRRVLLFAIVLFTLGIIVAQFQSLQALGFSLMASAGVATVILGIAAQPVLGNIVAGMQIALTRPARIGDSVYYEGNWGYVEDITYTYIQIQTWDQRRVIVPLRYFISKPFENWTIKDAHLTKPIYMKLDYTADVDAIRQKFDELLRGDDRWDGENEPNVIVTGIEDDTIEVRATCSAKDPSEAWALHCDLREALLNYIRQLEDGGYLPKRRVMLQERAGRSEEVDEWLQGSEA